MLIKNFESNDLSNLLHTALENLDYPSRQINSFLFPAVGAYLLSGMLKVSGIWLERF